MTRQEALQTLQFYTKSQTLVRHHLAVEAVMQALAQKLISRGEQGIDIEMWALTGLLHDADYEITRKTPEKHTIYLEEKLGNTLPKEVIQAIKAHNSKVTNVAPQTLLDWALVTCDELTGVVINVVLQQKEKRLAEIGPEMIINYMNEKQFVKNPARAQIFECETKLHISINEFTGITLHAMQSIANELGFTG